MIKRLSQSAGLLAVVGLLLAGAAFGQEATGTITGLVTDASGGAVGTANVTVTNTGTNIATKATTNVTGQYTVAQLPPGMYSVTVEASGFRKTTLSPQRLVVASTLHMDVSLEVGQVTESVTVDSTAPQINTDDAQLGQSMTNIPDLPILSGNGGRNMLDLVGLQPGVSVARADSEGSVVGNFSVNGQRSQSNNFLLDGADDNDLAINTPDANGVISPDAIAEFRVVTGPMKAEYGRNSGAIIESITKSGANSFHGGLTEIFRNKVLNANNFFLNASGTPKPAFNLNDFDAYVGGPIIKNRTFFFASYLGFRRVYGVSNSGTVFSDAERAAILANGVPAAQAIVNITPRANYGGNQDISAPVDRLNRDQGVMRIDHRFSDRNNLSLSYFTERSKELAPFAFSGASIPGFGELDYNTFHNAEVHDTHSFSPNVINEALMAFHRLDSPAVTPQNTTSPSSLGFTGIVPDDPSAAGPPLFVLNDIVIGNTYQGPQARRDNNWEYRDSITWIKGRQTFKFGAQYDAYEQNQIFDFINNGYEDFTGDVTAGSFGFSIPVLPGLENSDPAINDFASGWNYFFDQSNANRQGYRYKAFGAYAQDDIKLTRNFTLNLGLRYDYGTPLTEIHNQVSTIRPGQQSTVFPTAPVGLVFVGDQGISTSTYSPDKNNFAPRFGFAWDPFGKGKFVVRSGAAMFYNTPESELTLQFLGAPPFGAQIVSVLDADMTQPYSSSLVNPLTTNPFPFHTAKPGDPFDFTIAAPLYIARMDPNFRTPYSFQYDMQIEYQVSRNWSATAAYVGSQGRKLEDRRDMNPGIAGPGANTSNDDSRRIFNQNNPQDADYGGSVYTSLLNQLSDSNSNYNSLQLSLNKQMSNGFQLTNSYTYSHCIDNASGLRTNSNPFNAQRDRGNCATDVRQAYVGSAIYQLPFFKEQRGFVGHVLGGFAVSTVVTLASGIPFDITDSGDRSLTGSGDDRPNYIGGNVVFVDPRSNAFYDPSLQNSNEYFNGTGSGTATASANPYFNRVGTAGSWAAGAGYYGNFGRNVFHGPGLLNADVSLSKSTRITESQSLILRAEAFNFFNHTQFENPHSNIASSVFGRITAAHDPRLVQVSVRYTF